MDQMTTLIFLVFFFPFKRLNSASYHDCWLNQHREINFINKIENEDRILHFSFIFLSHFHGESKLSNAVILLTWINCFYWNYIILLFFNKYFFNINLISQINKSKFTKSMLILNWSSFNYEFPELTYRLDMD